MRNYLENIRVGRKLALFVGGSITSLLCVAGISLLAVRFIDQNGDAVRLESRKMALAERVAENLAGVAVHIGSMVMSKRYDAESASEVTALRKEYMDALAEAKSAAKTVEGRKLLDELEQRASDWRDTNIEITKMLKDGNVADATRKYQTDAIPLYGAVRTPVAAYLKWQDRRLADITQERESLVARANMAVGAIGIVMLLGAIGFGRIMTRSIRQPIAEAVGYLDRIAAGDLTCEIGQDRLGRKDELGEMSRAIRTMSANLRDMIKEITSGIHVLSSSSAELSASSGHMTGGSREASEKAHSVAAAAEQMSANTVSVAAAMEQTSTNLTHVTNATEQMTSTIAEIAGNSEKARRITVEATQQAARITEQMGQLGEAAREIGKVTETITEISSQTNLLALNATIEAARAGSAGKGFAVVANEIKELAQQTAAATEDIKARIASVQSSTTSGITEIGRVSQVINEVSDIVTSIATAIEEQAAATKDISEGIIQASAGVTDANVRVAQSSQASKEIARDISSVDLAAAGIADGSEQVRASSTELSHVAEQLQTTVARFKTSGSHSNLKAGAIHSAISAHSEWKSRLRHSIATGRCDVPAATIRADNQCKFGNWLYGQDIPSWEKDADGYRTVKQLHAEFHEEAARVAQLAVAGQREAAESALSGEFSRVSSALLQALSNWSAS